MKALLIFSVLSSFSVLGQTNIIAAKSHSANKMSDIRDTDNFGLPDESRLVTQVQYLKDDCLVETAEVTLFETRIVTDTICDHPFLNEKSIDIERIKAMYPQGTKFIGFDELEKSDRKIQKQVKKDQKERKSNVLIWLMVGGILFAGLTALLAAPVLFMPRKIMARS